MYVYLINNISINLFEHIFFSKLLAPDLLFWQSECRDDTWVEEKRKMIHL